MSHSIICTDLVSILDLRGSGLGGVRSRGPSISPQVSPWIGRLQACPIVRVEPVTRHDRWGLPFRTKRPGVVDWGSMYGIYGMHGVSGTYSWNLAFPGEGPHGLNPDTKTDIQQKLCSMSSRTRCYYFPWTGTDVRTSLSNDSHLPR